jgi:hypothetical protein
MTDDLVGNAARNLALLRFLVDTNPAHKDVDEQDCPHLHQGNEGDGMGWVCTDCGRFVDEQDDARDQALIQRQDAEEGR